jgi:hypothetical protein
MIRHIIILFANPCKIKGLLLSNIIVRYQNLQSTNVDAHLPYNSTVIEIKCQYKKLIITTKKLSFYIRNFRFKLL